MFTRSGGVNARNKFENMNDLVVKKKGTFMQVTAWIRLATPDTVIIPNGRTPRQKQETVTRELLQVRTQRSRPVRSTISQPSSTKSAQHSTLLTKKDLTMIISKIYQKDRSSSCIYLHI